MLATIKVCLFLCGVTLVALYPLTRATMARLDAGSAADAGQNKSATDGTPPAVKLRVPISLPVPISELLSSQSDVPVSIDPIPRPVVPGERSVSSSADAGQWNLISEAVSNSACTISSLAVGQTVDASLTTDDCDSNGKLVDVYLFNGTAGQNIVLAMNSTVFTTALELYGPGGQLIASNSGAGGPNSRISFTLQETGNYIIQATSSQANQIGSYTITLGIPNCTTTHVNLGQTISQSLTASDCFGTNRFYDNYTFSALSGQSIRIIMRSNTFVTRINLFGPPPGYEPLGVDDGSSGGIDSIIEFTVPANGTYLVSASSLAEITAGSYTLSVHTFCPKTPIALEQTISNLSLSPGDCVVGATGRHYDDFTLNGVQGQKIVSLMDTTHFTSLLQLYDANGQLLTSDDGGSLPYGGSGIEFTLPATGTYTIRATSLSGNQFGTYSISLFASVPCPSTSISLGQTIAGSLSSTDCRTVRGFADEYKFIGNAGQKIALTMNSTALAGTALNIYNSIGQELASRAGIPNSLILFTLPANGNYTIRASSFFVNQTGAYTLTLLDKDLPCATTPIDIGQPIFASLSTTDCVTETGYSDDFTFSGVQGQQVVATIDSTDFGTALSIFGPDGQISSIGVGRGTINTSASFVLAAAGTYTIRAHSASTLRVGSYQIALRNQSTPGNDNFSNALILAVAGEVNGTTVQATRETNEPLHAGVLGANSVWFRWRAPAQGQYTFSLGGSRFDSLLAVYAGTEINNLSHVASNDNVPNGTFSSVTFTAGANVDYSIAVDARTSGGLPGFFKLIYHSADYSPGFTVSGRTLNANVGFPGVTIVAKNLNEEIIATSVSNHDGTYSILIPQGIISFRLSAFDSRLIFGFVNFISISENQNHDFFREGGDTFIVVPVIGSIIGVPSAFNTTVTATAAGINAVPISCFVPSSGDSYICPGLLPYGTYTITPSHPSVSFSPASATLVSLTSNVVGLSFFNSQAPGHRISGRIAQANSPLSGVKVILTFAGSTSFVEAASDAAGNYSFGPLPAGGAYSVSASLPGFSLLPIGVANVPDLQSDQTLNFSATSNCSYSLSHLLQTIPASGGLNSFNITTNAACPWQARSNSALIDVTSSVTTGNGTIYYIATQNTGPARMLTITVAGQTFTVNQASGRPVLFDYDADGRSDLSVRRPSDGNWYIFRGTAGYMGMTFGINGDSMVPADYDGDGKTDIAMFRPSNGTWYIFNSESQSFAEFTWGVVGDIPVPADHDGDGKADLVIFRPSTGMWYTRFSNSTFSAVHFGVAGDKPVVGDFDGDGKYDVAVWRPSDGNWYILKSGVGFFAQTWGVSGDIPVPADYDGDGSTDVAIWRPSTGKWHRIQSTAGFDERTWGVSGDIPVPADYDGDGKADIAVFRPSNGMWYIVMATGGQLHQDFGQNGDVPTQSAFIY